MSPTPPLFSLPEARTRFTKSTREALNNKNIKPLLSTFSQVPGSENEKKCTLDQAFRGVLEEEIINHSSCENVLAIISLAIGGVTEGICTASTPFVLLGDVLDCLPLDQCDTIFTFVEKNVATWKSNTFYSAGKNYLLRMCNDLLRRLSKSQNTVFCGRIQLFLARLFPLSEKSGLNLQSQFNLENVTVFNTNEQESTLGQKHTEDREEGMDVEEGEMGDEEAPTTCSIPIDYNLYRKFWSLQDYFRNPVQCYEKISWKTFLKYSEEVLAVFKSYKLDDTQASRKKMEELKTGGEHVYFAKFLTSEKLMDLQLSDSNFRRHILLQYLILFQYLKGLEVEKAFHPFIAGPYNRLVGEIMQETGTRINIPPPSVSRTEIVFTGEKEQLAQAVARIKKIYEEKKKKTTTIAVEVKKSQHKYVIGPKGNSLQEILERTGVSVEIPPSDSISETVILRGEPEKLGQALTEVYAKANSFTVSSVAAPSWLHRFIIGKKGQNLAKITQQMPKVHIEFTEGEDKITLEGPTEDVNVAQEQIEGMVKDLINRMDYVEINIDHKFHRHLIGKSGANINRIKDQYKVSVRIPPDSEKSNLIRIEGDPQGVQQAKRELLELASRMENERTKDLIIEQRFHRTIIGQKGERIREIRDKFPEVIINFPDPAQKSDIVQLRGPKNEVEKCTKYMQKMVADLVENSYSISVPIFKQFHKNIIGKGGANIKKIREESNLQGCLPSTS
uniref:Testis cDNA clone: QtsA-10634, similar to human high density lipoprotein binding protein (vigilin)(HDLBP) n=2 Tax=Macaca fascicularis TaxID=9541 RepID=Q4R966_MACFA|nr:unnamed protein product [Macaca fascicularis]